MPVNDPLRIPLSWEYNNRDVTALAGALRKDGSDEPGKIPPVDLKSALASK